jgi:hypothetical protein
VTKVCTLNPYDTLNIFKVADVAGGTFERFMTLKGNSLLSTISIRRLDSGTVKVDYYEVIEAGYEKFLKSVSYSSTGIFEFWTLPFHTQIRAVITTTDISSFTLKITCRTDGEILRSSTFDGAPFDPADNKSIPISCYDSDTGKLFFVRCKDGVLITDPITAGAPLFFDGDIATTPGLEQVLSSTVVPVGKTRTLAKIHVSGSLSGKWEADINGGIIGSGRIASGNPNSTLEFIPRRSLTAGQTLALKFTSRAGPVSGVNYHIMMAET